MASGTARPSSAFVAIVLLATVSPAAAAIDGLDRTVSSAARVRFWLDYPFEKPYAGAAEGVYGKAFHVVGDLVIESIGPCDGDVLAIDIGS
jgi:hypothetical protein